MNLQDSVLAKLCVKAQFATREQLAECLQVQRKLADEQGNTPRLADVMLSQGVLDRSQLQSILDGHDTKSRRLFGEIALKWGLVNPEQLEACLALQAETKARGARTPRIGMLLVSRNHIKKHQVQAILDEQNKKIARCPGCGATFNVRGASPGTAVECMQCGRTLSILGAKELEPPIDADASMVQELPPAFKKAPKAPPSDRLGEFTFAEQLGQDALGTTYSARREGELVALKILNRELTEDAAFIERWTQRVKNAARIRHPNVRRIISIGNVKGIHYVASEFVAGGSLRQRLVAKGRLETEEALHVGAAIAKALGACHAGKVLHRDVRPSHILLGVDGRVQLANLGMSPPLTENILLIVDQGALAPFYMAPEQVVEDRTVDARSDIYSLGCTLYHVLAGRPPFEGQSASEILFRFCEDSMRPVREYNEKVPPTVDMIISKMIAAEPDNRYQDVQALAYDLSHPEAPRFGAAARG